MEYTLEMCSLYEKMTIKSTPVIIFSDHNMALPVWGTYASKLMQPLKLISFDYHADTHDPFVRKIGVHDFDFKKFEKETIKNINCQIENFCFEDVYKLSCEYVANDEHILTACLFKYISGYHIFCDLHDDEIESYQCSDRRRGINAFYHSKFSINNMSSEELEELCLVPFVLDFDLDYFTSPKIFDKKFIDNISFLIKKATIITIAREPKFFEYEKVDDNFSNNQALSTLLEVIQKVLI